MSKVTIGSFAIAASLLVSASFAPAADVTAKKILIKDNADPTKRQVLILSKDVGITFAGADNPAAGGASVHVYGSTTADDFCAILPPGGLWSSPGGNQRKFKDGATKNIAQVKDGRLLVKIKQDVPVISYTLADDAGQGAVNVQVQFGTGTRYCMRCGGTIVKDDGTKFLGKDCAAAACDAEPSSCDPPNPTTTTSTSSSTTSTSSTTVTTLGTILKVVLNTQNGRFNYAGLGLPGADARCNSIVPGSTHCTYARLLDAETAGELDGIKDINGMTVNSFWAIDNAANVQTQCIDDTMGGSFLNWEYSTAHTGTFASNATLNNVTGDLGAVQGASCLSQDWVGCCQ